MGSASGPHSGGQLHGPFHNEKLQNITWRMPLKTAGKRSLFPDPTWLLVTVEGGN